VSAERLLIALVTLNHAVLLAESLWHVVTALAGG